MPAGLPKDHVPLRQEQFMGLYSRGVTDTTPDNFFTDCLNTKYNEGEVSTRDGSTLVLSKLNIVRFFKYKRLGETPRYIMLDTSGNLWDSLYPGNPIYTDASFVDFSMVNYNNRCYITPHNRQQGLSGKNVLVYQGSGPGNCRATGCPAPVGFTLTGVAGAAGSVETGYHLIAVAYQTDSGYISAPGPANFLVFSAAGGTKINLSNLPIGPSYVRARVILASKAIPVSLWNGNQLGWALYFVPNGIINNNTDVTATIDFYDASLQSSADYLLDNLSSIPAGVGITTYNGRLLVWGANGEQHTLRASNPLDPETFNAATGLLSVDPSEAASGIRNCIEYRKSLVIAKSNRIYSSSDTGDDASTWSIEQVDMSTGTECFGFAKILDVKGTTSDRLFIADQSGLVDFNGMVKRPELSYNIEGIWKRINKAYFNLVQVVDDPQNHRLIISVPLDSATNISHLLYADYSKAFSTYYGNLVVDEKKIKWGIWNFGDAPVSVVADADSASYVGIIEVARAAGIYSIKSGLTDDNGSAIDSYIKTSLKTAMKGWLNHFGFLKLRAVGSGNLVVSLYSEDGANLVNVSTPIVLGATPGMEVEKLINYINEKISVKLRVSSFGEWFTISRFDLYAKPLWFRRPA